MRACLPRSEQGTAIGAPGIRGRQTYCVYEPSSDRLLLRRELTGIVDASQQREMVDVSPFPDRHLSRHSPERRRHLLVGTALLYLFGKNCNLGRALAHPT